MVTADNNYLFAAGALLVNLQRLQVQYDSFIICGPAVSDDEKQRIRTLEPRVIFKDFSPEDMEREYGVPCSTHGTSAVARFIRRYGYVTYLKNQCFTLLAEYRTVLVLDLDVLVLDNLEALFRADCDIAWRNGYTFYRKLAPLEKQLGKKLHAIPDFSCFTATTASPNGGLFLVHDSFDFQKAYADSLGFIKRYMPYLMAALDELSIGYACYKNHLSLLPLDETVYNVLLANCCAETKVIHFMGLDGNAKPWKNDIVQMVFPQWMQYYRHFSESTGIFSDVVTPYEHLGRDVLTPQLHQQHWLQFLSREDFTVLPQLRLEFNFTSDHIVLRYNDRMYYEFRYKFWERKKIQCGVVVEGNYATQVMAFTSIVNDICSKNVGFVKKKTSGWLGMVTEPYKPELAIKAFHTLFDITRPLREFFDGNS